MLSPDVSQMPVTSNNNKKTNGKLFSFYDQPQQFYCRAHHEPSHLKIVPHWCVFSHLG